MHIFFSRQCSTGIGSWNRFVPANYLQCYRARSKQCSGASGALLACRRLQPGASHEKASWWFPIWIIIPSSTSKTKQFLDHNWNTGAPLGRREHCHSQLLLPPLAKGLKWIQLLVLNKTLKSLIKVEYNPTRSIKRHRLFEHCRHCSLGNSGTTFLTAWYGLVWHPSSPQAFRRTRTSSASIFCDGTSFCSKTIEDLLQWWLALAGVGKRGKIMIYDDVYDDKWNVIVMIMILYMMILWGVWFVKRVETFETTNWSHDRCFWARRC